MECYDETGTDDDDEDLARETSGWVPSHLNGRLVVKRGDPRGNSTVDPEDMHAEMYRNTSCYKVVAREVRVTSDIDAPPSEGIPLGTGKLLSFFHFYFVFF